MTDASSFDLSDTSLTGITTEIAGDTTPQLGGNLDLNSNNITGIGNIGIGTDIPTSAVAIGNTNIIHAGIVTANYYYGDGSNLTNIGGGGLFVANDTGIHTTSNVMLEPRQQMELLTFSTLQF